MQLIPKKVILGFGLALILVIVNAMVSYQNTLNLIKANNWVAHTLDVLAHLESVLSNLKDVETDQRGFIITGNPTYLESYEATIKAVSEDLQSLRQLTEDNPGQQERLATLTPMAAERLMLLSKAIDLRRNQGFEAAQAMVLTGQGQQLMNNIQQVIAEMKFEEGELLAQRTQTATTSGQITILTFFVSAGIQVVLIVLVLFLLNRHLAERRQAAENLRHNEALLRQILDTNPNIIFVKDRQSNIILANQALATSYQMDVTDLVGRSHQDLHTEAGMSQEELQQWLTDDREVIDTGAPKNIFEAYTHRDGTTHWNHTQKLPLQLVDGQQGVLVISEDITELKRMEEQFQQSQKMEAVGRLAGGIAHDFNNLLTVITGYSELLLDRYFDKAHPHRRYVEEICKAGERASGLTRQLLAFSRKQVLQPEVLDLNTIVVNIGTMLQRLIGEDIDLLTVLDKNLWRVKADPGQIEQVLVNLVVNARDAMPQGGKLTLETANVELDERYIRQHVEVKSGFYVMLAVSDTGTGMSKETLSHIFEPFFTTKEQGKGTGLGLATVYGIIKQSSGHVWVYSEVGRGTMFKIYLPCFEESNAAIASSQARTQLPIGTETILLVEDEVEVRNLICEVLTKKGYKVLEAHNGDDAIMVCQQHDEPIHLLLTDVVMPGGMNGRELAEQLTSLHPELKVLYMSGYTDEAIIHHGVLDRGTVFLQKPFTPDALERRTREILDR